MIHTDYSLDFVFRAPPCVSHSACRLAGLVKFLVSVPRDAVEYGVIDGIVRNETSIIDAVMSPEQWDKQAGLVAKPAPQWQECLCRSVSRHLVALFYMPTCRFTCKCTQRPVCNNKDVSASEATPYAGTLSQDLQTGLISVCDIQYRTQLRSHCKNMLTLLEPVWL